MVEIHHDPVGGYYTLRIDGKFEGNYDTISEAREALEEEAEFEVLRTLLKEEGRR